MGGMIVYQGCLSRLRLTLSTTYLVTQIYQNFAGLSRWFPCHLKPSLEQGLSVQPCYIRRAL